MFRVVPCHLTEQFITLEFTSCAANRAKKTWKLKTFDVDSINTLLLTFYRNEIWCTYFIEIVTRLVHLRDANKSETVALALVISNNNFTGNTKVQEH